ncbi:MAG: carboxypeptidase-like regulatory domain-containing protein [Planctomycetota bacterium]
MSRSLLWGALLVASLTAWFVSMQARPAVRPDLSREAVDRRAADRSDESIARLDRSEATDVNRTTLPTGDVPLDSATSAGEAANGPPVITGVVVDPMGVPLAGIPVQASLDAWTGYEDWSRTHSPGRLLISTNSGDDGAFEIELDGSYLVTLSAAAPGRPVVEEQGCAEGDFVRLVVTPGATVEGVVTTSGAGDPVPDARVRLNYGPSLRETAIVETDALGRFRAEGLRPGDAGVIVDPPRHAISRWQDFTLEANETSRLEIVVEDGWTLSGRVRSEASGDGIAGATVSAWTLIGKNAKTDARGDFRIEGVRPSPGQLTAVAPGYGRREVRYRADEENIDIRLSAGCDVRGRVVDLEGRPVPDALVVVAGNANREKLQRDEWSKTTAAEDGGFELRSLRTDIELSMQLRAPGFATNYHDLSLPEKGGDVDLGDVELAPQAIAAGRVLAADGSPVGGAMLGVSQLKPSKEPVERVFQFKTRIFEAAEAGTFLVPGLGAGTWSLSAFTWGGRSTAVEVTLAEGERRDDIEIVFPGGTTVTGRVADEDREAISGAYVRLFPEEEQDTPILADECNEFGEFEIADVPDGRFTVRVTGPLPESGAPKKGYETRTIPGFVADGTHLDVEMARLDGLARGRVVDASGRGVPRAYLCRAVDGGSAAPGGVLADDGGRFDISVKGRGTTEVVAFRTADLSELGENENLMHAEYLVQRKILDDDGSAGRISVEGGSKGVELRIE